MYSVKYDKDQTMSYGCWECPKCGSMFYGGGKALHFATCPLKDQSGLFSYDDLIYRFGDIELHNAIERNKTPPLSPSGFWELVQKTYPELVRQMSKEDCPTYAEIGTCLECPAYLDTIRMRRVNKDDWEEIPGTEVRHCSKKYF